jgi:hypothetical protein
VRAPKEQMGGFRIQIKAQSVCEYGDTVGDGGSNFSPQQRQIRAPFGEGAPDSLPLWMRRTGQSMQYLNERHPTFVIPPAALIQSRQ